VCVTAGAPLVTIVTNFFNEARFLQDAIASIRAQTLEDWELLLVDDGSTDGSTEIAAEAAKRDPDRIRYFEHPRHANIGMSASRNVGLRHARARYIALLDGDDVWLPDVLERQLAQLQVHDEAGLIYGATEWWYSWTGDPSDRGRDCVPDLGVAEGTIIDGIPFVIGMLQRRLQAPCTCSTVSARHVADAVGGFEETFPGMCEDLVFVAKAALAAPVLVGRGCCGRYRQHAASCYTVAKSTGTAKAARKNFLIWLRKYVEQHGAGCRELLPVIDAELDRVDTTRGRGAAVRARNAAVTALRRMGWSAAE
jgi:glycosyltransferase involved in cell wall biosynthesis